jgi:integrase
MARTIRDANLETRTARSRLKARGKPHYRTIEPGLHLGYRKPLSGAGKWVVRHYIQDQAYEVKTIATADDNADADGVAILDFKQAQEEARARMVKRAHQKAGKTGPYLVADAMEDYFKSLESEGRSEAAVADARSKSGAFIVPKIGHREVASLDADDLRHWRTSVVNSRPRVRTKRGAKPKHREASSASSEADRGEEQRKRRSSTNRIWTTLRAALNRAFQDKKVDTDAAWRRVKPFGSVDKARARYLEVAEAVRLVNASDPEFRPMVKAALLTGARYGQLARLTVEDFNRDAGTVRMTTRKGDGEVKVYQVHLNKEGVEFFARACIGRGRRDSIFTKPGGDAWGRSDQARPMIEASGRARITPSANFHCLRHTCASHAIMNAVPLMVVAQNLGHSDTRMVELHYGHLSESFVAKAIRDGAQQFGFKPDGKVTSISGAQ